MTPDNILLIDKPKGLTSYDVIRKLKNVFPGEKIGHAGTLDPNATGLMIVGVGSGTKRLREFVGLDKTYEAEILFGIKTDSGDIDGKITGQSEPKAFEENTLKKVVSKLVGKRILPVSKYSATKIGGEPAYKKARRGESLPYLKREMEVFSSKILSLDPLKILLKVSSGTYIRSIAEEIGTKLGVHSTLKNLRRIKVGSLDVSDAKTL